MGKILLDDELNDEQLLNVRAGNKSANAKEKQIEALNKIKKELENNYIPLKTKPSLDEDELNDEQLEGIKAGRSHI